MKVDIIIGANLGDEGKGTVVAACAKASKTKVLNVLTNGGSQRAHSIMTPDGSFTFQHFGSGTYHNADSFFSRFFVVNPVSFVEEHHRLTERLKDMDNLMFRDSGCRWSTPFDMLANAIIEHLRRTGKHGSCGMGIWETILRYRDTGYNMGFDDFNALDNDMKVKYLLDVKHYFEKKRICDEIPSQWKCIWDDMRIITHFISDCEYFGKATIAVNGLADLLASYPYEHLVFENGQGLMLSDTGKDIAGTTPSLTGVDYAKALIDGIDGIYETNLHYVTRPYMTRHGKGHLVHEMSRQKVSAGIGEDRTNHHNTFQDSFRYAPLDIHTLYNRVTCDAAKLPGGNMILDVTHCDEMDRIAEFKGLFGDVRTFDSAMV